MALRSALCVDTIVDTNTTITMQRNERTSSLLRSLPSCCSFHAARAAFLKCISSWYRKYRRVLVRECPRQQPREATQRPRRLPAEEKTAAGPGACAVLPAGCVAHPKEQTQVSCHIKLQMVKLEPSSSSENKTTSAYHSASHLSICRITALQRIHQPYSVKPFATGNWALSNDGSITTLLR